MKKVLALLLAFVMMLGVLAACGEKTEQPDLPADPPAQTDTPDTPDTPAEPGTPTEPDAPTESETPDEPEVPSVPAADEMTYSAYMALSGQEKEAFRAAFASTDEFFDWYRAAQKAHQDSIPKLEMGPDGTIDLSQLTGGN